MEFSVKNTGVGSHSLLQGIFPRSNPDLQHCSQILYRLSQQGSLARGAGDSVSETCVGVCGFFAVFKDCKHKESVGEQYMLQAGCRMP